MQPLQLKPADLAPPPFRQLHPERFPPIPDYLTQPPPPSAFQGNTEAFPGRLRDIISPAGLPPSRTCQKHFTQEASWSGSKPPQQAALSMEVFQFYPISKIAPAKGWLGSNFSRFYV